MYATAQIRNTTIGYDGRENAVRSHGTKGLAPVPKAILVVEDTEEIRDGIERLLKAAGYSVNSARDEEDAISSARRAKPDLILVSPGAPARLVISRALRIRKRAGLTETIPIVIFSVDTLDEGAEVENRRKVYLTRPDNFDQLRQFLRRLLEPGDFAR